MLYYALMFLIVGLIAGALGIYGVAVVASKVAWVLFLPAAWLLVDRLHGGALAAILCIVGYVALLALGFTWRFRSGAWRRIRLIEPVPDAVEEARL